MLSSLQNLHATDYPTLGQLEKIQFYYVLVLSLVAPCCFTIRFTRFEIFLYTGLSRASNLHMDS